MGAGKRIEYIDLMKGIGILLVVIQHGHFLPEPDYLCVRVWLSANMPLFFFISGLFLPCKRPAAGVARGWTRSLLVPCLFFSALGMLLISVMAGGNLHIADSPGILFDELFLRNNVPLWFLRALIIALAISWTLAKAFGGKWQKMAVLCLLMILSWYTKAHEEYLRQLPEWPHRIIAGSNVAEAIVLLPFMWVGHMLAEIRPPASCAIGRKWAAALLAVSVAAAIAIDTPFYHWHELYGWVSWSTVMGSAVCGIAIIYSAAILLQGCSPLAALGRCSLIVLCTHYIVIFVCINAFGATRPVGAIVALALIPAIVPACLRWLPWACAR